MEAEWQPEVAVAVIAISLRPPVPPAPLQVRNTVEERILRLQDKKRLVFEGTVGGDAASLSQLSEDDLRFLFQ